MKRYIVSKLWLHILLAATAQQTTYAFTTSSFNVKSSLSPKSSFEKTQLNLFSSSQQNNNDIIDDAAEESSAINRRSFFSKAVGGVAFTGVVANGFSVQGPTPFKPQPKSLLGKVVVITGGNTGLGLESGKRLAAAGATVVLTSRNLVKGEKAVQSVKDYVLEQTGEVNNNVYTLPLDLCDLESVKKFPELLKSSNVLKGSNNYIDVLMNNAGVMAVPDLQITKDGFEKTFQSNHLGHFALTGLLLPYLNPEGSRIVNVSSMAYLIASKGLDMSNLNGESEYKPWDAYGRSKLENILFTKELQRRVNDAGKKITVAALHPGAVRTDLPRYIIGEENFVSMQDAAPTLADELKVLPLMYFTKGVDRGASTQIYLSAFQGNDNDIAGKFFFNMKDTKLSPAALDLYKAKELWKVSENMSGVKYQF